MNDKKMTTAEQMAYMQKLAAYYNEKGEDALTEDIMKSIREEKARLAMLPGNNPKTVHYIGRDGEDVTDEVMPKVWAVIGAFAVLMLILAVTA